MKTRDNTIDFFRGIAAISIIFIHTVCWSGDLYVPMWLKCLSLIIDVPLFVFISGMTVNFNVDFFSTIKRIIKLWYKWLIFLVIYFAIAIIIDIHYLNPKTITQALFFRFDGGMLPVVKGSLWFIFMFFVVMIIGNIIIYLYNKKFKTLDNFKYVLLVLFLFYGMDLYNDDFIIFNPLILMYTFIYCLGYYLYNFKFKSFKSFAILFISNILLFLFLRYVSDYHFSDMTIAKGISGFPQLIYLSYSFISMLIVTYLKNKITIKDKNILVFVGKNALLFYFCQGIGGSMLYYIYPYISALPGIAKLIILFSINVIITTMVTLLLYFISKKMDNIKWNISFFEKIKQ